MFDVLVVDQDHDVRESLSDALTDQAIPHRLAETGAEALAMVEHDRPAVVLLDLQMPQWDSFVFCAGLEIEGLRDDLSLVGMTTDPNVDCCSSISYTDDLLSKPFNLGELYAVVDRHLPRRVRSRPLGEVGRQVRG